MTKNVLPVLVALVVLCILPVMPAGATEATDQIDVSLGREAMAADVATSLEPSATAPTLSGVDMPSWTPPSGAPKNPQMWNALGMALVAMAITLMVGCAVYILLFKGKM